MALWLPHSEADDLTLVPADSPFLQQRLATLSAAATSKTGNVPWIEQVMMLASTATIPPASGGPGKLFPTVKLMTTRDLEVLKR